MVSDGCILDECPDRKKGKTAEVSADEAEGHPSKIVNRSVRFLIIGEARDQFWYGFVGWGGQFRMTLFAMKALLAGEENESSTVPGFVLVICLKARIDLCKTYT